VDPESFIGAVFVWTDDALAAWQAATRPLRSRGPAPLLAASEVLTMELVGEFLGIDCDSAIPCYFQRHHLPLFPAIAAVHRTTFTRQASNLWAAKEALWPRAVAELPCDPGLAIVDSIPVPVCRLAHAKRCRRFGAEAAFGWDATSRSFFSGLRVHLRVQWPGVVTAVSAAPANRSDLELIPELVDGLGGIVLADRNYWNPGLRDELAAEGIALLTPYRHRSKDPTPAGSKLLNRVRRQVETVASQLVERYRLKRVWARDAWHLTNRLVRKVLSHTLAVVCNALQGVDEPRQLARLLAD
jgi:hypothetical protein